ncbi:TetR/AcrR family transcriptional regulator [Tunturiibacter gelidiferens]|uniref:TetR/AcrR family transcriptional regulator n=1 Tax=Tunturiibacter gelidiferens TaxID=3069689 RepID=UPI003D9BC0AE
MLEAAASLLAEVGYDAATMTEIADRANASIGTVYQYFPNKPAIVLALRNQYVAEMEERWAHLNEQNVAEMTVKQIAHHLVEVTTRFVDEHPAYFAILDAPVKYKRSQEARNRLRERIANVFRSKRPAISQEMAYRMANVSLAIIKSMNKLYAEANFKEREELVKEYKLALAAYLESSLVPSHKK